MKVEVRFADERGSIAYVGMNNLFIISDKRITTRSGLKRRIRDLVLQYHKYRIQREYNVLDWNTQVPLFRGCVNDEL